MRRAVAIGTLFVFLFGAVGAAPVSPPPQQKSLIKHLFGPKGFLLAGVSTAIQHVRNVPEEWGSGAAGLGKRFASAFGHHLVKATVQFGVAKAFHEDLKYYPSEQQGFRHRLEHALVSTVYVRKTNGEGVKVSAAKISGNAAGGFVSRLWQPASLHTVSSGFASTGISFGVDAGLNVVREFWPEIRHPRQRRDSAKVDLVQPQPAIETETMAELEVVELGDDADGCIECDLANESL
jgi:hypothetical protein